MLRCPKPSELLLLGSFLLIFGAEQQTSPNEEALAVANVNRPEAYYLTGNIENFLPGKPANTANVSFRLVRPDRSNVVVSCPRFDTRDRCFTYTKREVVNGKSYSVGVIDYQKKDEKHVAMVELSDELGPLLTADTQIRNSVASQKPSPLFWLAILAFVAAAVQFVHLRAVKQ